MAVIPAVHELNLYQYVVASFVLVIYYIICRALHPILSNFETVWELVLTNEVSSVLSQILFTFSQPIAVMASSPTLCANAVQALVRYIIDCIRVAVYLFVSVA